MPFPNLPLTSQRLQLRFLAQTDRSDLYEIFSNPKAMRYWSTPPWTSPDQASELIQASQQGAANSSYLQLGIIHIETYKLIGTTTLYAFNHQCRRCEIGYMLNPSYQGQGYMTEALTTLITYAFTSINLRRLEADIHPNNFSSAKLLDRLNFRQEGFLRERWIVNGEVSDTALYGLLKSDFTPKPQ